MIDEEKLAMLRNMFASQVTDSSYSQFSKFYFHSMADTIETLWKITQTAEKLIKSEHRSMFNHIDFQAYENAIAALKDKT